MPAAYIQNVCLNLPLTNPLRHLIIITMTSSGGTFYSLRRRCEKSIGAQPGIETTTFGSKVKGLSPKYSPNNLKGVK